MSPSLGVWATSGSEVTALVLAEAGFDWIVLDAQHGHYDDAAMISALRTLTHVGIDTGVRLARLDSALIGRALDAGADQVIVPLINSADDAAQAVDAAFYPPLGSRSWGPMVDDYGSPSDASAINDRVSCAVMIETRAGLDAVNAIAAVPGISMIFVGPTDLSLSLGTSVDELIADESHDSALRRVVAACTEQGIVAGIWAGEPRRVPALAALGFTAIAAATEKWVVAEGGRHALNISKALE